MGRMASSGGVSTVTSSGPEAIDAVLRACGLVDRSERGKLALTGSDRAEFLNGQVSNDITALEPGTGCSAALLTNKGKMLGEVRVLATADELLLDTERLSLQALFDVIRRFSIGWDVALHKRTLERGLLALVGPQADAVALATGATLPDADEHAHVATTVGAHEVHLIRTPLGLDVLCDAESTPAVRDTLVAAGAVVVGEDAADVARVRLGRPRYGDDLDDTVIPQEAGLNDRLVSFTKGCYVGQETVARLHWRGKPNRHLRLVRLPGPVKSGASVRLAAGSDGEPGREVGRLGTVVHDPDAGWTALAILRREAQPGAAVAVGDDGAEAVVAEAPSASS